MKLIELKPKLSAELLDTIFHFANEERTALESVVFKAIDKTPTYLRKSLNILCQLEIVRISSAKIEIADEYFDRKREPTMRLLKDAIENFRPLQEFVSIVRQGKSEVKAAKFLKASLDIENETNDILRILSEYRRFLESEQTTSSTRAKKKSEERAEKAQFWIESDGQLRYVETKYSKDVIAKIESRRFKNPAFVDQQRIDALKTISNSQFDLSKLIRLCEEINDAFRSENYFSVGVLVRAVIDHIPPIFGMKSFGELANNLGSKSFKDVMCNLDNFNRKIADGILHTHIRRKEFLPNFTSVDCRSGVDLLLSEIINELN